MRCFWCILLAFCILSCGGNSAGPEPEPEPITEPEQKPELKSESEYKELNYENLAGGWYYKMHPSWSYTFGTRADNSVREVDFFLNESFTGKYYVSDPYIIMRGTETVGVISRASFDDVRCFVATITVTKTDTLISPYPASIGRDTLRVPYPEWITVKTRTEIVLTLTALSENYRDLFNLPITEDTLMSMNTEKFESLLDSLQKNNVTDQSHLLGRTFQFRDTPFRQ